MAALDSAAPWAVAEWVANGRIRVRYGGGAEPATRFMIGSITKTVTGRLLAEAVTDGAMGLGDPLPGPSFFGRRITPGDLAAHVSGLPRLPFGMDVASSHPYGEWDLERVRRAFRRTRLWRRTGTRYVYSNFGYAVLGDVVAERRKTSFEPLALGLLDRMGLADPGFDLPAPGLDGKGVPMEPWRLAAFAPAGGLTMTLPDLVRYGMAVQRGEGEAAHLVRSWRRPAAPTIWQRLRYRGERAPVAGFGWHFAPDGALTHSGQVAGYRSSIQLYPAGSGRAVLSASWRSDLAGVTLEALG